MKVFVRLQKYINIIKTLVFIMFFYPILAGANGTTVISSQEDWLAGQNVKTDAFVSAGFLKLASVAGSANDDFNSGLFQQRWIEVNPGATGVLLDGQSLHFWAPFSPSERQALETPQFQALNGLVIELEYSSIDLSQFFLMGAMGEEYTVQTTSSGVIYIFDDSTQVVANLDGQTGIQHFRFVFLSNSVEFWKKLASESYWTFLTVLPFDKSLMKFGFGETPAFENSGGIDFLVHKISSLPLEPIGTWTSAPVYLTETPTTIGTISWEQDVPPGASLEIQTSTSEDGISWSPWSASYGDNFGSIITSPSRRWIRAAAIFKADPSNLRSPVLNSITIDYPPADPLAPVISSLSHPEKQWSSQGIIDLSWIQPPESPAREVQYTLWHVDSLGLTLSSEVIAVPQPEQGQAHSMTLAASVEGSQHINMVVLGDAFSGGTTSTTKTYSFSYDGTVPGQTDISSPTHPELLFTNNHSPVFNLVATDLMSGVAGFALALDASNTGDPGSEITSTEATVRYANLDNGTYYLHAAAIDKAGNRGPVAHYGIRIDFTGDLLGKDFVKALPNPVRGNTAVIEYELAADATDVQLEFFATGGIKLHQMEGPNRVGKNQISWDISNLANGVYFYRVRAKSSIDGKEFVVTKKLAVIR